jgi:hypothetical protein
MIGNKYNYSDVYVRNMTASILDVLEGEIYWEYEFSTGTVAVDVPFYYSMTGDEKFLLDAFTDDIVSENRKTELNTDQIPRGILTWTGWEQLSDEIANPNVWMKVTLEDKEEVKKVLARVRPIPMSHKFEMTITLNSENDAFKCAEAVLDTLGVYRYFQFQYRMINIIGVINFTDSPTFEKVREINNTTKNEVTYKMDFEVRTYYPAFRKPRMSQSRVELRDNWSDAYNYDPFMKEDDIIPVPRRTKWYSSIYKATGNADNKGDINSINGNGL